MSDDDRRRPPAMIHRCTTDEVVAAFRTWHDQRIQLSKQMHEFAATIEPAGRRPVVRGHDMEGVRMVGVETVSADYTAPPEGWKLERKHGAISPLRSKKAGKAFAAAIDELAQPGLCRILPGVPGLIFDFPSMGHCGAAIRDDGKLYISWPFEPSESYIVAMADAGCWERVPLSEYFALLEAGSEVEVHQGG